MVGVGGDGVVDNGVSVDGVGVCGSGGSGVCNSVDGGGVDGGCVVCVSMYDGIAVIAGMYEVDGVVDFVAGGCGYCRWCCECGYV